MKQFLFLYNKSKHNRLKLLLQIVSVLMVVFFTLLTPLFFGYFVDTIIGLADYSPSIFTVIVGIFGGPDTLRNNLWIGGLILIGLSLISGVFMILRGWLNGVVSENMAEAIRNELFDHIQKYPYATHVQTTSGDLIQRCTSDVDQIRRFLATQLSELVYALAIASFSAFILFSIHPNLAWISIISLPILFVFAYVFFLKMQKAFRLSDEAEADMSTTIQENLVGVRVVKAFNQESNEIQKFDKKNVIYRDLTYRLIHLLGMYWGFSDFICLLQILAVVIFGVQFALAGELSVGNYFVFVSYVSMVLWPVRNVGRIVSDMGKVGVSVDRLHEILDKPIEDIFKGEAYQIQGEVCFDHVSFKYDDGIQYVLEDVSFTIKAGETVAIMGPTGSGKSSLVALLTRLYDVSSGQITIDHHPIEAFALNKLRQQIGIVLQEPYLYSKSIKDNIAIAQQDATLDQIKQAAKLARFDHVVESFDKGYDTLVGEKGVTLSGGQKQRLAIARCLINKASILIFDDSLSAVDTQTDQAIQEALADVSKDITTIIITHRISSAKHADRILVLDQGRLVQMGDHQSLMQEKGLYQSIAKIQIENQGGSDESL